SLPISAASPKPLRITFAPARANARAMPRPMPLVEPVTRAVLFLNCMSSSCFLSVETSRRTLRSTRMEPMRLRDRLRDRLRARHAAGLVAFDELVAAREAEVGDVGREEHAPAPLDEDAQLAAERRHLAEVVRAPEQPGRQSAQVHAEQRGDALQMADRRHHAA